MRKKLLVLTVLMLVFCSGMAAAGTAAKWNGFQALKIVSGGKDIKAAEPAIVVKGKTFVPLSALKQMGLTVSADGKTVKIDLPKPPKQAKPPLTDQQLQEISKNVGIVYAYFPDGKVLQGSGFLVDGGYFVTNYHVAGGANRLAITIDGQSYSTNGESAFQEKDLDIFGVKIGATSTLKLNPTPPADGSRVYAIGYPHAQYKVTQGTVYGSFNIDGSRFTSSTAPVDKGNSGGILINDTGEVVGITTVGFNNEKSIVKSMSHSIYHVIEAIKNLK